MRPLSALGRLLLSAVFAGHLVGAAEPQPLDRTLEPYLKQFGLPAISAAVFKQGVIIASGKAGTRRVGTDIPVRIDDRFHIG